jgi:transposase
LHFHDLRGTAATKFYLAGLSERVIAEIMGWEEETVARIIRRYVDRTAATKNLIDMLNRVGDASRAAAEATEREHRVAKPIAKPAKEQK